MKRILCAALFICCSLPALAQATGNDLLRECELATKPEPKMTTEDFAQSLHCLGYVSGVVDTFSLWRVASGDKHIQSPNLPCFPNGHLENLQMVRVVLKFMQDNPDKLHWGAPELILTALRNAFPCK
jgi:hypothetical protein